MVLGFAVLLLVDFGDLRVFGWCAAGAILSYGLRYCSRRNSAVSCLDCISIVFGLVGCYNTFLWFLRWCSTVLG